MKRSRSMTLEQCAERMTKLLARKPRKKVTRAYLATLPKRAAVVVKPSDYVPLETQAERDARRYAEWEARGKPPSPSSPRRDRRRPRAREQSQMEPLLSRIAMAQDMLCAGCNQALDLDSDDDASQPSLDHVVPKSKGGGNQGNFLAMHRVCNGRKADRMPTGCELLWLSAVNARLGIVAGV